MFRIHLSLYFHSFLGTEISGSIFQKFLRLALKPIQSAWLNNIYDCSMRDPELKAVDNQATLYLIFHST